MAVHVFTTLRLPQAELSQLRQEHAELQRSSQAVGSQDTAAPAQDLAALTQRVRVTVHRVASVNMAHQPGCSTRRKQPA